MIASTDLYSDLELVCHDSIRLMRIVAGTPGSALQCRLIVTRLADVRGNFDALSYTWDSDTDFQLASINDHEVAVRRNLFDFLRCLRSNNHDMVVWVDALCINQKDGQERNHQVRMMQSIYTLAACTRVWLGHHLTGLRDFMAATTAESGHVGAAVAWLELEEPVAVLLALLRHRYWTRIWILQEVILAQDVYVHCGDQEQGWATFVSICRRLLQMAKGDGLQYLRTFTESTLMHINGLRSRGIRRTLPELLRDYSRQSSTEIKDRVYGLLGLINDSSDPLCLDSEGSTSSDRTGQPIIDYALPLPTLFARLMDLYSTQAAFGFALLLWEALELNSCRLTTEDEELRVQVKLYLSPTGLELYQQPIPRFFTYEFSTGNNGTSTQKWFSFCPLPFSTDLQDPRKVFLGLGISDLYVHDSVSGNVTSCAVRMMHRARKQSLYRDWCKTFEAALILVSHPRLALEGLAYLPRDNTYSVHLPLKALKSLYEIEHFRKTTISAQSSDNDARSKKEDSVKIQIHPKNHRVPTTEAQYLREKARQDELNELNGRQWTMILDDLDGRDLALRTDTRKSLMHDGSTTNIEGPLSTRRNFDFLRLCCWTSRRKSADHKRGKGTANTGDIVMLPFRQQQPYVRLA